MDTGLAESVNACLVCSVESMLKLFLVLLITFFVFLVICGDVCVQLTHLSLNDRADIFVAHFIIIMKT